MQLQFPVVQNKVGKLKEEGMHRSYDYHQNYQYGWNTTSQEYADHIARIERMPSMVTDVPPPRFPSVYQAFTDQPHNNRLNIEEKQEDHLPRLNHHKHGQEARKKVHFVDQEKRITEIDRNRKTEDHKEFDVNMAADGFINQNKKNFQLYKWEHSN